MLSQDDEVRTLPTTAMPADWVMVPKPQDEKHSAPSKKVLHEIKAADRGTVAPAKCVSGKISWSSGNNCCGRRRCFEP